MTYFLHVRSSAEDRYSGAVDDLVRPVLEEVGAVLDGTAGGTFLGGGTYPSDNVYYFEADEDAAERALERVRAAAGGRPVALGETEGEEV